MKLPRCSRCCTPFLIIVMLTVILSAGVAFASSGGGHGEDAEPKGWVATDTYRVMNFVALAVGLFFLLRKPVGQMLKSRIDGIEEQLSDLEAKKQAAEKKLAEYDERLSRLDAEAENIVAEYVRQGNEAKVRILKEAEKAAERLEEQARRNIEHEFNQARSKLQAEVMEKALAKAEDIIRERITQADQENLIDEYLEKVVV